jgi:hypothetical protein
MIQHAGRLAFERSVCGLEADLERQRRVNVSGCFPAAAIVAALTKLPSVEIHDRPLVVIVIRSSW